MIYIENNQLWLNKPKKIQKEVILSQSSNFKKDMKQKNAHPPGMGLIKT